MRFQGGETWRARWRQALIGKGLWVLVWPHSLSALEPFSTSCWFQCVSDRLRSDAFFRSNEMGLPLKSLAIWCHLKSRDFGEVPKMFVTANPRQFMQAPRLPSASIGSCELGDQSHYACGGTQHCSTCWAFFMGDWNSFKMFNTFKKTPWYYDTSLKQVLQREDDRVWVLLASKPSWAMNAVDLSWGFQACIHISRGFSASCRRMTRTILS